MKKCALTRKVRLTIRVYGNNNTEFTATISTPVWVMLYILLVEGLPHWWQLRLMRPRPQQFQQTTFLSWLPGGSQSTWFWEPRRRAIFSNSLWTLWVGSSTIASLVTAFTVSSSVTVKLSTQPHFFSKFSGHHHAPLLPPELRQVW